VPSGNKIGIRLLAAVQLLDGSLHGFALGVGDGSKAAKLSSVMIAWQVHVFDLAVLLDNGAKNHLIDAVRDVALEKSVRCWSCHFAGRINVGLLDENFVRHFCGLEIGGR
jgi:hypothetical protein